jgi:hypothetical protein
LTNLHDFRTYFLFTFDIIALLSGRSKLPAFVKKKKKKKLKIVLVEAHLSCNLTITYSSVDSHTGDVQVKAQTEQGSSAQCFSCPDWLWCPSSFLFQRRFPQNGSSMFMKLTYHLHLTQTSRKYGSEIVVSRGRYVALNSCLVRTFRYILLVLYSQVLWDNKSVRRIKMRPAEFTETSESHHSSRLPNGREERRFLSYSDECLRPCKSGAIPRLTHKSSWCA